MGGLDPEVAEAAALAHDLGHPPFGHTGEAALNRAIRSSGSGEVFDGNAQSFRIVSKLAEWGDGPQQVEGLNLCRATLRAILKYPRIIDANSSDPHASSGGVYASEIEDFTFAMELPGGRANSRTLEAEIMDWSDDISYAVHDFEDFLRTGHIPLSLLGRHSPERVEFLKRAESGSTSVPPDRIEVALDLLRSELIQHADGGSAGSLGLPTLRSALLRRLVAAFELDSDQAMAVRDPDAVALVETLKLLTSVYVMHTATASKRRRSQEKIVSELFKIILRDQPSGSSARRNGDLARRARDVADQIASLTDNSAIELHRKYMTSAPGSTVS